MNAGRGKPFAPRECARCDLQQGGFEYVGWIWVTNGEPRDRNYRHIFICQKFGDGAGPFAPAEMDRTIDLVNREIEWRQACDQFDGDVRVILAKTPQTRNKPFGAE